MPEPTLDEDAQDIYDDFAEAVNMTPREMDKWLATDESKAVAAEDAAKAEMLGDEAGRRILELKAVKKAKLTDEDLGHMHKVVSYIHRHLRQRPDKTDDEIRVLPWAHGLKNWGHDPLKK